MQTISNTTMETAMKFVLNRAEDESVDDEIALVHDDGRETGISIQDARSYGGGYVVNLYSGEGADFSVKSLGFTKTLKAAKAIALKRATSR